MALTPGAVPGAGADPRTELTHVVPGRRPRPAPVVVEAPGRLDRWRAVLADRTPAMPLRVLAGTATAVLVLAVTAWLAVRWGSGEDPGTTVAAATAPASASPTPAPGAGPPPEDAGPVTAADWSAVVAELYRVRAQAFAAASPELLGGVWVDGSPQRAADEAHARSLADAGERLRGFAPTVADVAVVSRSPERVELRLSDGWDAYDVVAADRPDEAPVRTEPARAVTPVRVVLVPTPAGWRLESAQRLG